MLPSFLSENYPLYINTLGSLNLQLVANFRARQKRVFGLDTVTQAAPIAQPSTSGETFDKKNLFKVTPKQAADKKAIIKASIATQYIGFAEGIIGSSTESYRQQAGLFANTGKYSANDVIFVSIGGRRGTVEQQKTQQDRTIKEAIKAVEAGATILTDNKAYTDASTYNTGEKRLYANMESKGYTYSEITVDGQLIGTWRKPTQPSTNVTPVLESQSKFTGEMTYAYGTEKRAGVTANTTFDAILSGERTATTRFEKDGNLNYWKQAKVGDVITWKAADGRTVDVVVTRELHPLKGSGKTPELWSQLEGWSTERFNKKVKPNIGQAYQIEFRLAQPTEGKPSQNDINNLPDIEPCGG
jgi:hypothetical protein